MLKVWVLLIAWNADGNFVALPDHFNTYAACRAIGRENARVVRFPIQWKCERK
jgi:hypothetical protein